MSNVTTSFGTITVYEKINTNKICVVFIHGLGGQSEQFKPIFNYFSQTFHVISMDLFGHGQSDDTTSYKLTDMAQQYCDLLPKDKSYVIIAHSLGVAIANIMYSLVKDQIKGMVWIGAQLTINKQRFNSFLNTPLWLINVWRWYYRWGGIYSQSVAQYVFYPSASLQVLRNQLKYNQASRTNTLLNIYKQLEWPTIQSFQAIQVPVQLIVGEYDKSTPISATLHVYNSLLHHNSNTMQQYQPRLSYFKSFGISPNSIHPYPLISKSCGHNPMVEDVYTTLGQITHFFQFLKINCHAPSPSKEHKMDDPYALKNYKKWKAIQSVSECIGKSQFRAMKILREIDPEHNPQLLINNYKNIGLVVDMSRDVPPYHPEQFQPVPTSLMKYHKSSLVYQCWGDVYKPMYIKQSFISKIPPDDKDVDFFVELCKDYWNMYPDKEIALHCHYGYNRTGFMIIAAMYKMGLVNHIMAGVEAFKEGRAPGIK